jgi:hypothetical protein
MAEIIKFNSLNIISGRVSNRLAQQPTMVQLEGPIDKEPINQIISYGGRLKYTIAGDITYTTSIILGMMKTDELGFSDVYAALQQYALTIIGEGQKVPPLSSIYFTPTTVTFRLTNQLREISQFPNLRERNTGLVKVPFSQIGDEFEEAMIKFVDNIDTIARSNEPNLNQ